MTELLDPGRLFRIALLLILGMVAVFAEAAPLGVGPTAPPSPDLLMCVLVYWSIRRPGSTPLLAVFTLGLIRDFLTDVPLGAGTLSLVIVTELFKSQRHHMQRLNIMLEWLVVTGAVLSSTAFVWLLVVLTLAQPPYVIELLHQCLYTAMIYPLIALTLRWVFRISWRKAKVA